MSSKEERKSIVTACVAALVLHGKIAYHGSSSDDASKSFDVAEAFVGEMLRRYPHALDSEDDDG